MVYIFHPLPLVNIKIKSPAKQKRPPVGGPLKNIRLLEQSYCCFFLQLSFFAQQGLVQSALHFFSAFLVHSGFVESVG